MTDPVISPSGITYDREVLVKHLEKNGEFDPITRKPCTVDSIYPNTALKQIIEEFLGKNPWAYEYDEHQTLESICF